MVILRGYFHRGHHFLDQSNVWTNKCFLSLNEPKAALATSTKFPKNNLYTFIFVISHECVRCLSSFHSHFLVHFLHLSREPNLIFHLSGEPNLIFRPSAVTSPSLQWIISLSDLRLVLCTLFLWELLTASILPNKLTLISKNFKWKCFDTYFCFLGRLFGFPSNEWVLFCRTCKTWEVAMIVYFLQQLQQQIVLMVL